MLYAIKLNFNCVYEIECSSHSLVDKIYCDDFPCTITLNQNTNSIYIGNSDNTVIIIDGSNNKVISRIHLPNYPSSRWSSITTSLDELYVDPSNNILYVKEEVIGPPNEGGVSLATSFFKIHLNGILCPEYFIHLFECDILPNTERYMPGHISKLILRKHDVFSKSGTLNNSFAVNSKSSLLYLTDSWEKRIEEINANNKILRTFKINHNYKFMTINPNGNKLYLANSGYFSNSLDIIHLQKEPTVNPPLSTENRNH